MKRHLTLVIGTAVGVAAFVAPTAATAAQAPASCYGAWHGRDINNLRDTEAGAWGAGGVSWRTDCHVSHGYQVLASGEVEDILANKKAAVHALQCGAWG